MSRFISRTMLWVTPWMVGLVWYEACKTQNYWLIGGAFVAAVAVNVGWNMLLEHYASAQSRDRWTS